MAENSIVARVLIALLVFAGARWFVEFLWAEYVRRGGE